MLCLRMNGLRIKCSFYLREAQEQQAEFAMKGGDVKCQHDTKHAYFEQSQEARNLET